MSRRQLCRRAFEPFFALAWADSVAEAHGWLSRERFAALLADSRSLEQGLAGLLSVVEAAPGMRVVVLTERLDAPSRVRLVTSGVSHLERPVALIRVLALLRGLPVV